MKAGLALALAAVDGLRATGLRPRKRLVFLWNSDEEIGSDSSRNTIEREARRSDAVLVLEPAAGADGRLKTARKGIGTAELIVTGRAAHAGLDPGAGVNAVHEAGQQIVRLKQMNDSLADLFASYGDRWRNGIKRRSRSRASGSRHPIHARGRCGEAESEIARPAPHSAGCSPGSARRNQSPAA